MGGIISYFSSLFGTKEVKILILGLDSAGKTTILYKLKCGEVVQTLPTIGFNTEVIQCQNIKFQAWDLGGQSSLRPYWKCYFSKTTAIVFVVDSSDRERIGIAREELHQLLSDPELTYAVLAVFANKQDVEGAMTPGEISDKLQLHNIKTQTWGIHSTCALTGSGLDNAMKWLANTINEKK